ncbi:GNAT family N-acetyltransferase [Sedimentibacter sp. zth1]|uniref:GNAT family N-acetyltransferase n=1 Tax=Sedimentibacter sp. zth1 TaxID=2816908 RepID=UPI001A916863|nr:GNAT family N-acetyltransferase [Sedimentibacter sp. zth1]QSX07001.1 GNAT family N-acetyltransferase [Sedimentibacter sp. zth1]
MNIELRTIDRENMYDVIELQVADEQKKFVASNSFSLLQANYEVDMYPFAIYKDNELVGFVMYDLDDEIDMYGMCRLMVDKKYQNQGIGKLAIEKLFDVVREEHGNVKFYTSAEPTNTVALGLYEKMGFENTGKIVYDEVLMIKQL